MDSGSPKATINVVSVADDWEGLYLNGELVTSGHRIDDQDLEFLFKKHPELGIVFKSSERWDLFDVEGWDAPERLPDDFDPEVESTETPDGGPE